LKGVILSEKSFSRSIKMFKASKSLNLYFEYEIGIIVFCFKNTVFEVKVVSNLLILLMKIFSQNFTRFLTKE
jgi:hypothetical protein